MKGLDGIQGQVYVGTSCVFKLDPTGYLGLFFSLLFLWMTIQGFLCTIMRHPCKATLETVCSTPQDVKQFGGNLSNLDFIILPCI